MLFLPNASLAAEGLFRSNDVVCLIGGANVVGAQEHGYLETLSRLAFPTLNLRFRSLAHEGDTVFAQPRDYNYPSIAKQLDQTGATFVLSYFGQNEALQGTNQLTEFIAGYEKLLTQGAHDGRRVALVSPIPFEALDPPLPDLSLHNGDVRQYALAIRKLADKRGFAFVDLLDAMAASHIARLTSDGIHLNASGHWHYDSALAERLGVSRVGSEVQVDSVTGVLSRPDWERVRQVVVAKNRLWFKYSRPTNWAFLGGDRIDQPSSRDHLNSKIRWFPEEMQKFVPLIEQQETKIATLTGAGAGRVKGAER
jgi:hypothetical protein